MKMFTVNDAVAFLDNRVSRSKLYELVELRQIEHYRVGGKILFTEDQLRAYLDSCLVPREEAVQSPPSQSPSTRPSRLKNLSLD